MKQRDINFTIESVEVFNLADKVQGVFTLGCAGLTQTSEQEVVLKLTSKLSTQFPEDFSENAERDSWATVHCGSGLGWSISDGTCYQLV